MYSRIGRQTTRVLQPTMVRPRLVEEGVPIGSTTTSSLNDDHVDDIEMEYHSQQQQDRPQNTKVLHHQGSSSLARAAASTSNNNRSSSMKRSSPRKGIIVIGGKQTTSSSTNCYNDGPTSSMAAEAYTCSPTYNNCLSSSLSAAYHSPSTPYYVQQSPSLTTYSLPTSAHTSASSMSSTIAASPSSYSHSTPNNFSQASSPAPPPRRYHIEIGADYRPTEPMQGVEDHSTPKPLLVVDGANVAYAYQQQRPDIRGIQRIVDYFEQQLAPQAMDDVIRLVIVLPASWIQRYATTRKNQSWAQCDWEQHQYRVVHALHDRLIPAPSTDDDDAYALTIAMQQQSSQSVPSYIISNDHFRDAQARDRGIAKFLTEKKARISYTFANMGSIDATGGEPVLDFVPNPRHPAIEELQELRQRQGC